MNRLHHVWLWLFNDRCFLTVCVCVWFNKLCFSIITMIMKFALQILFELFGQSRMIYKIMIMSLRAWIRFYYLIIPFILPLLYHHWQDIDSINITVIDDKKNENLKTHKKCSVRVLSSKKPFGQAATIGFPFQYFFLKIRIKNNIQNFKVKLIKIIVIDVYIQMITKINNENVKKNLNHWHFWV